MILNLLLKTVDVLVFQGGFGSGHAFIAPIPIGFIKGLVTVSGGVGLVGNFQGYRVGRNGPIGPNKKFPITLLGQVYWA